MLVLDFENAYYQNKRYIIIDLQIVRHFVHNSKIISKYSRISANHDIEYKVILITSIIQVSVKKNKLTRP